MRHLVRLAVAQSCPRFARIVIGIVEKENDLAADFLLQPPRRLHFREQKSFRKEPARLLAKTDDRGAHAAASPFTVSFVPSTGWSARLKMTHPAHPMSGNHK